MTSSRDKFFHVSSSLQDAFAASKTSKRATSEREPPAEDEQTFSLRKLFGADEEKTAPSEAPPLFFLTTSLYMTLYLLLYSSSAVAAVEGSDKPSVSISSLWRDADSSDDDVELDETAHKDVEM